MVWFGVGCICCLMFRFGFEGVLLRCACDCSVLTCVGVACCALVSFAGVGCCLCLLMVVV